MARKNADQTFIDKCWDCMFNNISPAMGMDESHMHRLRELALDGVKYRKMMKTMQAPAPVG